MAFWPDLLSGRLLGGVPASVNFRHGTLEAEPEPTELASGAQGLDTDLATFAAAYLKQFSAIYPQFFIVKNI